MGSSMPAHIRTALFVDFDNVFGSLHGIRQSAAMAFGTRPDLWLKFFESGQHAQLTDAIAPLATRSILIRKCYLNPEGSIDPRRSATAGDEAIVSTDRSYSTAPIQFRTFRGSFTRAGFSVVDCPRLTRGTKNSADIVMAMDIMDALRHPTQFDEFIILSADADFTPVLVRLREHDRRTSVYANRVAAAAYRAASDYLIGEHDFIERGLGIEPNGARVDTEETNCLIAARPLRTPISAVARAIAEHVGREGRMPINDAAAVLYQYEDFRDQTAGRWLGFGTATRLFEELTRLEPTLCLDKSDPARWLISVEVIDNSMTPAERALDEIRRILTASPRPMLLSQIGNLVRRRVRDLPYQGWPGGQTLSEFLSGAADPHIAVRAAGDGASIVYDPARHDPDDVSINPRYPTETAPPDDAREDSLQSGPGIPDDAPTGDASDAAAMSLEPALPDTGPIAAMASGAADDGVEQGESGPGTGPIFGDTFRARLLAGIHGVLGQNDAPVSLKVVGDAVEYLLPAPNHWPDDAVSLEDFLRQLTDGHVALLPAAGGFVYDPTRHDPFVLTITDDDGRTIPSPVLQALVQHVSAVTDCPRLLPDRYRALFQAIVSSLSHGQFDMASDFGLRELAWSIEAACERAGSPLSSDTIMYVLTTLDDQRVWFRADTRENASRLASVYADSIAAHCADNRVPLSDTDVVLLRRWLTAEDGITAASVNESQMAAP